MYFLHIINGGKILDETNNSNDLNFTVDSKPKIDYKKEKTTLSKVGVSYFLLLLIMFFVPTLLLSVFPVKNNDILLLFNLTKKSIKTVLVISKNRYYNWY